MLLLVDLLDLILLVLLIGFPIYWFIVLIKNEVKLNFIKYFSINVIVLAIVILFFAWWDSKSNYLLLEYYGYNFDGMNHNEYYKNVLPENKVEVDKLIRSNSGIGWSLKAFFGYFTLITYSLLVYPILKFFYKR